MEEGKSSMGNLYDLTKRILSYRRGIIGKNNDPGHECESGIRILLPCIDRHYYINLRTELDPGSETGIKRDMWMYFPYSHSNGGSLWPDIDKLKARLNELKQSGKKLPDKLDELRKCNNLEEFNKKIETGREYGFPYSKTGLIFKVISENNELSFEPERFKEFHREDGSENSISKKLASLFGPDEPPLKEEEYPSIPWHIEKHLIYEDLSEALAKGKIWIFYPISFRGILVSVLAARVPKKELDTVTDMLPIVSDAISVKLLSRYEGFEKNSPLFGIKDTRSVLTLLSTLAAQCRLNEVAREGNRIRFFSSEPITNGGKISDVKVYDFQINASLNRVEFAFPPDALGEKAWKERAEYFETLWGFAAPLLDRFSGTYRSNLALVRAALMSRNFSHNIGSHVLGSPELFFPLGKKPEGISSEAIRYTGTESGKTEGNLHILHQYLQNRLDYIARALNPSLERPEPLFFVNEVLNTFFRQGVLLENLLKDQGFSSANKKICFYVRVRTGTKEKEKWAVYELLEWNGSRSELSRFQLVKGQKPRDALIGVAGGTTGAQALYSFLENIMRNAAKYGANRDKSKFLGISLDLRNAKICETVHHEHYFVLEVSENLSDTNGLDVGDNGGKTVVETIRDCLDTDLITDTSGTIGKGQGIQEMKASAEFLSEAHVFLSDWKGCSCKGCEECCESDKKNKYKDCEEKRDACDAGRYCEYIHKGCEGDRKREHGVNGPQPLRCYVTKRKGSIKTDPDANQRNFLVYQLLIPKARLVGVVDTYPPNPNQNPNKPKAYAGTDAVFAHASVEDLAETGAAFGVVLDSDGADIAEFVGEICARHNALPFRLIVLTNSPQRTDVWKRDPIVWQMLNGYETGNDNQGKGDTRKPFSPADHLPARRLRFIESPALHGIFASGKCDPDLSFLGAKGWNAALLMLYHRWLIAFKGVPASEDKAWKLVIGFERSREQIASRWETPLESFDAQVQRSLFEKDRMDAPVALEVHLQGRTQTEGRWEEWANPLSSKNAGEFTPGSLEKSDIVFSEGQSYVVFDNHGKAIPGVSERALDSGIRCIHEFSGANNIALFQSLESPPQEPFSFAWFIYSVLESALVNVAIIDERVAGAAADSKVLKNLNRAGVFPVFSLRERDGGDVADGNDMSDGSARFWLNDPSLESKLCAGPAPIQEKRRKELETEGVELSVPSVALACQSTGAQRKVCSPTEEVDANNLVHTLDAVIIHEGVVDVVLGNPFWEKEGAENNLFALAPRIIRTSGRGSQPRHISPSLPFMEFSELSENTYLALNKLKLGKGVLGVFGPKAQNKK
uniref:Uncharacterized protein n=1 Tax=Candidatus Kentrum sp. MB TaxID=2138164 RepID=A0A450X5V0_9GAMM|nr:MAG: hypothetical protein BECKMB1821G_GA0114241_100937 [Candidatus Kentron sp. MB]